MITKPKGTKDIYGIEAKKWQYVSKVIDDVMEKYNYNFIRVPVFESSELFHFYHEQMEQKSLADYQLLEKNENHKICMMVS